MHFSPSACHRHLMERNVPSMAYRGGPVEPWQEALREKLVELIHLPGEPRVHLEPKALWRREHELGTIEKLVFTAEPYADVPAYFGLPRNASEPVPVMICLQGHSTGMHNSIAVALHDETRLIEVDGDRDFALGCMKRGFAALCIEQRAFGERSEEDLAQPFPHGCHDAVMHALMLGRTLMGERVFDVDRGIDYLAARSEVDSQRVGVMGDSGGGLISMVVAAVLPRIRFAMPACCFCTYRESIMSIGHCADNYVPGLLRHAEMADVAGLIAPKPIVIVAGREDPIFPIHGTEQAFADLQTVYDAAGVPDRCRLVVGDEGHRFYENLAWPVLLEVLGMSDPVPYR